MCRKLETETEKVLPFYASSLTPEEDDDAAAAMQEAPSEPLAEVKKWSPHHHHLNTWAWTTVKQCYIQFILRGQIGQLKCTGNTVYNRILILL